MINFNKISKAVLCLALTAGMTTAHAASGQVTFTKISRVSVASITDRTSPNYSVQIVGRGTVSGSKPRDITLNLSNSAGTELQALTINAVFDHCVKMARRKMIRPSPVDVAINFVDNDLSAGGNGALYISNESNLINCHEFR